MLVMMLVVHLVFGFRRLRDRDYYRDDPLVQRLLGLDAQAQNRIPVTAGSSPQLPYISLDGRLPFHRAGRSGEDDRSLARGSIARAAAWPTRDPPRQPTRQAVSNSSSEISTTLTISNVPTLKTTRSGGPRSVVTLASSAVTSLLTAASQA